MQKKLLIIRSVSFQQLDTNLIGIKKVFPEHDIHLLTHEHGRKLAEKYQDIKEILIYPHKQGFDFSRKVKIPDREQYDAIVVPVTNLTGAGFSNVLMFSLALPAKKIYMCNLVSEIKPLSKAGILLLWLRNSIYKGISWGFGGVVGCIVWIVLLLSGILTKKQKV